MLAADVLDGEPLGKRRQHRCQVIGGVRGPGPSPGHRHQSVVQLDVTPQTFLNTDTAGPDEVAAGVNGAGSQRQGDEEIGLAWEAVHVGLGAGADHLEQRSTAVDHGADRGDGVGDRRAIAPLQRGDRQIAVEVLLRRPEAISGSGGVTGALGHPGQLMCVTPVMTPVSCSIATPASNIRCRAEPVTAAER